MVRATTLAGFCEKVMQPASDEERTASLELATLAFDSGALRQVTQKNEAFGFRSRTKSERRQPTDSHRSRKQGFHSTSPVQAVRA
jgi:ribosomal protein L34